MNKQKKHAHFIGICGAGMSAVAKLLLDDGWTVSGSDDGFYPPASTFLKSIGIKKIQTPYSKNNIPKNTDLIIIGKHKKLIPEMNSEVKYALVCGIPVKSYPEVICTLAKNKTNIVVAGSSGKSSIATLLSWVLHKSGISPSYFIGAIPKNNIQPARLDSGDFFVLEGDEYPTSNWCNSSKFLYYNPVHIILTSCEHDHIDIFPTHKEYLDCFKELVKKIPKHGILLSCLDDKFTQEVAKEASSKKITYSAYNKKADWFAKNLDFKKDIALELMNNGVKICDIKSSLFGLHNAQNIIAVSALVLKLELITIKQLQDAVIMFKGNHNRIENISKVTKKPLYKDVASSAQKVKASLSAIRVRHPNRHITLIFEPHSSSFRLNSSYKWYENLFDSVDSIVLLEPKTIKTENDNNLLIENIKKTIKSDTNIVYIKNEKEVEKYFKKHIKSVDVAIVMSSGNTEKIVKKLFSNLA